MSLTLSVVVPIYNEIHTLDTVLSNVVQALPGISKELVLVDDGSSDGTREWLLDTFGGATGGGATGGGTTGQADHTEIEGDRATASLSATTTFTLEPSAVAMLYRSCAEVVETAAVSVKVIFHQRNQGKGAALRTGFQAATGDVIVIQDADLEYDPQDWAQMWRLIAEGKADVVYGSRFYGNPHRVLYFHHLLGNKVISTLVDLTCNTTLTDIEVCYKMFRREVLDGIVLTCSDFGFEVEFTMKVARSRRRWRMYEMGISYYGRSYDEGKKINWKDGVKALWYILKFWLT